MKKALVLLVTLCTVFASGTPRETAVKITSRLCNATSEIQSSGVPVSYKGESYILTSSWGVLEETSGVCNEITLPETNEKIVAELSFLSWNLGIALLKTSKPVETVFNLDTEIPATASATDRKIVGFELKETAVSSKRARVVAAKSTRHHILGLQFVNELATEKLGQGYVGAPLYKDGLQAIISSQWIQIIPGSRARVNEWKTGDETLSNQLVAIPLSLIQEKLKSSTQEIETFQPALSKLGKRDEIFTKNLFWKINCPENAGQPPKDGIGPIGGADGVGIGGGMKGVETCTVQVRTQKDIHLAYPNFFEKSVYDQILSFAGENENFLIPFLFARDPGGKIGRMPFLSLPQFFSETYVEKRTPVLQYPKAPPVTPITKYDQVRTESLKMRALLADTYSLIYKRDDERMVYRSIFALTLLLDSPIWQEMKFLDFEYHDLTQNDFAQDIEYQGKPLRTVVLDQFNALRRILYPFRGDE